MKPRQITEKQVNLLCTLLSSSRLMPDHAAFQAGMTVSAAQRVMNALSTRGLTYEDEPVGCGTRYRTSWGITHEGTEWIRNNRPIVERVHLDLGFNLEDIATIYTQQLA